MMACYVISSVASCKLEMALFNSNFSVLFVYSQLVVLFHAELCPSVSAGVVARVVKACGTSFFSIVHTSDKKEEKSCNAAMLQTTAAVHPGGGAVVNGEGRMIGLVTRYTNHIAATPWI
jgi:S1-C subfamily serine protease